MGTHGCLELHVPWQGETLTCHSLGSTGELGTGALRQDFLGLIIFLGFLLLRCRRTGGQPGLCRWCRPRRRARGLTRLCKRNRAGAERPGVHRPVGRAPQTTAAHSTAPAAANSAGWCFGTLILGIIHLHIPTAFAAQSSQWGKSWSPARGPGWLAMGMGAASLCSRSPRCDTSSSAATSQKPS